jgi:hypothetical protein
MQMFSGYAGDVNHLNTTRERLMLQGNLAINRPQFGRLGFKFNPGGHQRTEFY